MENNFAERRRKAIIRRRIFLGAVVLVLALVIALAAFIVSAIVSKDDSAKDADSDTSSAISSDVVSGTESKSESLQSESKPSTVVRGKYTLDAEFSKLLVVNAQNPLPEDYDYEGNLATVEQKYINGSLRQIDKDILPYMLAMIEAAWSDGVKLYIWSPYRSYSTQNMLFENQVKRCMDKGLDRASAEEEAATVVARPGTSEHHTGLACDFNMASDAFEETEMFRWMCENAEDYGFIMRYSKDKQDITGVIHESWHWRFVGINVAKEINQLDMCLEEYIEYKNK